jgi:hypothetical protein
VVRPTFKNLKVELEKTVKEGTVAEFDCEAHSDPAPRITWRYVSFFEVLLTASIAEALIF